MHTLRREFARTARPAGSAAAALLVLLAAGCSSSDGGGSISPGSGQSPDPIVLDFPVAYVKRPLPMAPT